MSLLLVHQPSDDLIGIELNDPATLNSFSLEMAEEFSKILKKYSNAKGIYVFSNLPKLFCSGGNLKFYSKLNSAEQGKKANERISKVLDKLHKIPVPTIVAVGGDCLGGGMEFISCFDYVVATPKAHFGFWQRKLALIYGWGGGQRWLQRISQHKLKQLSLEARLISSYEAKQLDLVDHICTDSQIEQFCIDWLRAQASLPYEPIKAFKSFEPSNERKLFNKLWLNKTHKKILQRFS